MSKLVCIGELLIDFQSKGEGSLKETAEFVKKAGGAPANVCVQAAKLGCKTMYLSKVGADGFGDFLIDALKKENVDTTGIGQTEDCDTSLAFVNFKAGGEREFSFYRRTAADLSFSADEFTDVEFERGDALEFGSVALATQNNRAAHDRLIEKATRAGAIVCFDPNVRLNLWSDAQMLKRVILDYAGRCDVLKLGDDELRFVTGADGIDDGVNALVTSAKLIAVTRGARGAKLFVKGGKACDFSGVKVNAVDTTGAGDSFFGGFIAELLRRGVTPDTLTEIDGDKILKFACKCGSFTTTGFGAIAAMGDRRSVEKIGE